MEAFLEDPAFRTYALCSAVLVLKLMLSSVYTGMRRQVVQGYANEEDARVFGKDAAHAAVADAPAVAHGLRIQRNDAENIPAFFAIGLIYVLSGASATGAAIYLWTFTIARIVHTFCYINHLQPWRAISFGVGFLVLVGMSVSTILRVL